MKYHLLNTRKRYSPQAQQIMLRDKVALACFDATVDIEDIAPGDAVFLYENKVGIIAMGYAQRSVRYRTFNGHKDAACERKLKNFVKLPTPISPALITAIAKNFADYDKGVFVRTRFPLPGTVGRVLIAITEAIT